MIHEERLKDALVALWSKAYFAGQPDDAGCSFAATGHPCAVLYRRLDGQTQILGTGTDYAQALADAIAKQAVERRVGTSDRRAKPATFTPEP